jgi:SAM-dependent methyltransferase
MHECSKALLRRLHDVRFATRYFVGSGIDIGAGPDSLDSHREFFPLISRVMDWDIEDGDAQMLDGLADDTFDFAHSSHCLEHMVDPHAAIANWVRVVKPGGHLVITVPDEDLYEQGLFPPVFNTDHKWTFSIYKSRSWSSRLVNLFDLLSRLEDRVEVVKLELLDQAFSYRAPLGDQTQGPIAESAIEIILRKRPAQERERGGRLPVHR